MTVEDAHQIPAFTEGRSRIQRLEAEASRVSDELRRERDQIAGNSPSTHNLPNPLPTRLNVGCGYDIRPGFLNVDNGDWHKPDLVADITNLVMLPSGHFEEIVAQDVLEHIERNKQISTLREWGRLLAPNGILKVRVPSLTDMAALAKLPNWQNEERQNYLINMVYGTQAYPGDYHLCGYTPWTVASLAREAGLVIAEANLKDVWLYDLSFRPVDAFELLSSEEYIHWAYFSELHRIPDQSGVSYWTAQLDAGKSRAEVLGGMQYCEDKT